MDNNVINSWKKWEILAKIALSKKDHYNKIGDLLTEVMDNSSIPYFYLVFDFLKEEGAIKYLEKIGDMQPITLDKKKIIRIAYEYTYIEFARDFIVKTKKWAIT